MNRRNTIKSLMALALAPSLLNKASAFYPSDIQKPQGLIKGDKVAVIAPGSSVSSPDDIKSAVDALNGLGFEIKLMPHVANGSGYKTRTVSERLSDLHNAFSDPETKAIWAIRGGYGSMQLLDKIDYQLIAENPKLFIGYSDITAMHSAIYKFSKLITFHGPVLLSSFTQYTVENFQKVAYSGKSSNILLSNPDSSSGLRSAYPTRMINPGIANGRLVGGNLSLISALCGTAYLPDMNNKILFLEDVGEPPYRIDRMLTQLKLSGIFNGINGIIFGKCEDCSAGRTRSTWDPSLGEVLDNILKPLGMPVFYGMMIGHSSNQLTLPIGINVKMDADNGTIELLESAVRN